MKNLDSKNSNKTGTLASLKMGVAVILFPVLVSAQGFKTAGYRNIKAYTDDFAKNEMYIKKSLIEYSQSIIENQLESRADATSTRIVEKLKNINNILEKNDIGFQKNTELRDSFMRMNAKTIDCMTNGSLILNDYEAQTAYDVCTIEKNIGQKEANLLDYFRELKNYEDTKVSFGSKYNLTAENVVCDNLFEYNGYQNILFYKMNVIDQKMIASVNKVNINDFRDCIVASDKLYLEVMEKTNTYKDVYKDNSLNEATIAFANFLKNQNLQIAELFNNFADEYVAFQAIKNQETYTPESIEQYNNAVRIYNYKKNRVFDTLASIQRQKKQLYNNWYKTNRTFLKYNSKFEDIHNSITYAEAE